MVRPRAMISLIGFVAAFLTSAQCASYASQRSLQQPLLIHDQPLAETRKGNDSISFNLIDLLSQSPEHTILVRLLQRTRLVPTLNRLQEFDDGRGLTILAPTNDAFLRKKQEQVAVRESTLGAASDSPTFWQYLLDDEWQAENVASSSQCIWNNGVCVAASNVNAVARQHLLYHVFNYTLPFSLSDDTGFHSPSDPLPKQDKPQMQTTLHFPSRRMLTEPTHPGRVPVPDEEDHGGLLGHHGQRMRVALRPDSNEDQKGIVSYFRSSKAKHKSLYFGADESGRGGAKSLSEDWRSRNGVIHYIDSVIDLPPALEQVIRTHPRLQSLRRLVSDETLTSISTVPHLTLFLPASEPSRSSMCSSRLTLRRLRAGRIGSTQATWLHMSGSGLGDRSPVYSASLRAEGHVSLPTALGGSISVETDEGEIKVMEARVVQEDILTENGVVHLIDSLILPFGDLDMTIEANLLALNASRFVDLIYEAGLQHYINKPAHLQRHDQEAFTFLAPRDDVH